jgi:DNA-binding response OmpR family regulator
LLQTDGDGVTVTVRLDRAALDGGRDDVLDALRRLVAAAGGAPAGLHSATDPNGVRIHPGTRAVTRAGAEVTLSRLEYDLLLFLARHPRRVFTRSQLLHQVWGHAHTSARTVDVHVSRLRSKLGEPPLVTTVYGIGYRLADEALVTVAAD